VTSRRALHLVLSLCAAAAGCGDGGGTPARLPPSTLRLTCGGFNRGFAASLMVAAVIEPPRPRDVVLDVYQGGRRFPVTCRAGERLCMSEVPWVSTQGTLGPSNLLGSSVWWDVGAGAEHAECKPDAGFVMPQPAGRAEVVAGKLRVTWRPVAGAWKYAATFRDLDLRPPEQRQPRTLGRIVTAGTLAEFELPDGLPELAVVDLEAWALDPDTFTGAEVPAGRANRAMRSIPVVGAPWSLLQPTDFADGALALEAPAGGRLAVILLNLAGEDRALATVQATGTGPPARALTPAPRGASPGRPAGAAVRGSVPAASAAVRTFCTFRSPLERLYELAPYPTAVRRQATLLLETPSTQLYVDDEDVAGFTSSALARLADSAERAAASVTLRSGPLPDVDGNGKFILFFTSVLGPRSPCFASEDDLWSPESCTGLAAPSNAADLIHVHPPSGLEDELGAPLSDAAQWAVVEGAMPYALQRMADSGRLGYDYVRNSAVTYGRMALARTLAGSGYHDAELRRLAAPLLFTRGGLGQGGYASARLFPYDDLGPTGELRRVAMEAYVLFLADRLGPAFVERFFEEAVGALTLDHATELPLPLAYALWTGALVFSNEPSSPWRGFDYLGEDWTPLHEKFLPFEAAALEAGAAVEVTLRRNGFDVLVTGVAGPQGGAVTVTSSAEVKPYVVAIPFRGELP